MEIFVVGCPRSGTTLLQSMLASHPALCTFPESHVLVVGVGRQGRQLTGWSRRIELIRQLSLDTESLADLSTQEKVGILCNKRRFLEKALTLMDSAAERQGKLGWIEKTPEHLFFSKEIERARPNAKFIHIIRENGTQVACSVVSMWKLVNENKGLIRKWIETINDIRIIFYSGLLKNFMSIGSIKELFFARRFLRAYVLWRDCLKISLSRKGDVNHRCISLEELTKKPQETLMALSEWLGISYSHEMMQYQTIVQSIVRSDEPWKASNSGELKTKRQSRENELSEEERLILLRLESAPIESVQKLLRSLPPFAK